MNETYKIRTWGGSLAVVLPQKLVRDLTLNAGDEVKILALSNNAIRVEVAQRAKKNGRRK